MKSMKLSKFIKTLYLKKIIKITKKNIIYLNFKKNVWNYETHTIYTIFVSYYYKSNYFMKFNIIFIATAENTIPLDNYHDMVI